MAGQKISDMPTKATLDTTDRVPIISSAPTGRDENYRVNLYDLVTFTQAGTGAVARSTQVELRETVKVTQFMGVLSTTAAFQAAIDYLCGLSYRGELIIPRGTYSLTAALNVTKGIKIRGDGRENTVLSWTGGTVTGINASMALSSDWGFELRDLSLVNVTATPTAGDGLRMYLCYYSRVTNVRIAGFYNGHHVTQSPLSRIEQLHIDGYVNAGLLLDGGLGFNVSYEKTTIDGYNTGTYAIKLVDMNDKCTFTDGECSRSTYALYTDATSFATALRPEFCTFTRWGFDSCTNGIDLCKVVGFKFDSCFISCRPNYGADIGTRGAVENTTFINCSFHNNGKSAVRIGASASYTTIQGGECISNGTTTANTYSDIKAENGAGLFRIQNMDMRAGWDVTATAKYRVEIGTGVTDGYIITNNWLANGGTGRIQDGTNGANKVVSNVNV